MWEDLKVSLEKVEAGARKEKPDQSRLGFGVHFTDHMFQMAWSRQEGWHDARICPYRHLAMDPAAMVFHYGQAIFEGMKVYRGEQGQLYLFRPIDNFERMNGSALRLCMPRFSSQLLFKALKGLIYLERDWVPHTEGATLYVRPTMIATEPALGVRPASEYLLYIILSPVGAYYDRGFEPISIYVSDDCARAVAGGVGSAKASGNYAASLQMQEMARKAGYSQVLWLDACQRRYVEEVGTSNIFFVMGDSLVTPALGDSILPGLTRDSVIKLAQSWDIEVVERKISIDELLKANQQGLLQEAFGTGTAAVISPIGELYYQGEVHTIGNGQTGSLAKRLFTELQALQNGQREDPFKWRVRVW